MANPAVKTEVAPASVVKKTVVKRVRSELGRNDLINKLSKKHDLTKQLTRELIKGLFEEIATGISRGKPYEILGYGKFYISERKARQGRNPRTGEGLDLPASKTVRFKVGRKLKAAVKP